VPFLGIDLVRDVDTSEVFVLETNPTGQVVMLTSRTGRMIQQEHGLDFAAQFDAVEVMTRKLIEKTRALAR